MTEISLGSTINTVEGWRPFLEQWSQDWLTTKKRFSSVIRKNKWLGFPPATEKQIQTLEKKLGYRLSPSFRSFLQVSNGWRRLGIFTRRIRTVTQIEWLKVCDPGQIEVLDEFQEFNEKYGGLSLQEYFSYSARAQQYFDKEHFKSTLLISDPVFGDSAIYLLNPMVVTEDGEWEAWFSAHWVPGIVRYPSFFHLLMCEYQSFRSIELKIKGDKDVVGPFGGVYAPDKPRHEAERIGPGKPISRRLTVEELIEQLTGPSAKNRKDAAYKLMRCESKSHDPKDERPYLVEPLVRILQSTLEREIRCAAACIMGTYGDEKAIKPLVLAIKDPEVAWAAIDGLFSLNMYHPSPLIVEGLCDFLSKPQDRSSTESAIRILKDYREPRVEAVILYILDNNPDKQVCSSAAFALTCVSKKAADELMTRLKHPDPKIREACAAAIRQTKDKRAIPELQKLLSDEDPNIRRQAETSIEWLEEGLTFPL